MKKLQLLILTLLFALTNSGIATAQWSALGNGLNGQVNAILEFQNELYVGGKFTANGTGTSALNHIAKWNGTSWQAVGSGFDEEVKSLVIFNNELYAGGVFTHSGAVSTDHVAKLSGGTWVEVGEGFNATVNCMIVFQDVLYAGGAFSASGPNSVTKIAKLASNTWVNPNNTIITGPVYAMAEHLGTLYIGGYFSPISVMKLNGSTWTSIGTLSGPVYALGSFQYQSNTTKYLYIGGDFTVAPSFGLCVYNGSSYSTPFNQYTQPSKVYAILPTYSKLFTGGEFTVSATWGAGQTRVATNIAQKAYNTPWDTLSATFSAAAKVYALGTYTNRLVAGGTFTSINGVTCTNIAIRSTTVGIDEVSENVTDFTFFPSPMMENATLRIITKTPLQHPTLGIYDAQSRLIRNYSSNGMLLNNETEFEIKRDGLSSGIYYYLVTDENGNGVLSNKFIVQ
ncbi:MAG: hypothetical protein IPJ66_07705 [Bacteroidetes bacterium]|nr:hypothetical protein [Bacteroidota bacterium]MBL0139898.1 hypothetical protein [Bacteroidota bacterium]